jgi:N-acetylglucosamine malate deacetylase 1
MESLSRRNLLIRSGVLGGALAAGSPPAATAGAPQSVGPPGEKRRLKVIVTGGHPGDPEYGCGGTVARYTDLGHEVVLLYLNKGEWPPKSEGADRVAEAKNACAILKARPLYAGQINSQAIVDAAHYEAFRKVLEAEQPNAVFTHWPIDNHADHRAISMLVYDAWLQMKKRFALYYYEVSSGEDTVQFSPTHYVDITETEPRKRLACYAHASQTPDRYYALQEQVTRLRGIESGHRQAEAYIRHIQSPDFTLPLASSENRLP